MPGNLERLRLHSIVDDGCRSRKDTGVVDLLRRLPRPRVRAVPQANLGDESSQGTLSEQMLGEIALQELSGVFGLLVAFGGELNRHVGLAGVLRPVDVGVALTVAY